MGWGTLGCSNLTASGTRGGVARDVTPPAISSSPVNRVHNHRQTQTNRVS